MSAEKDLLEKIKENDEQLKAARRDVSSLKIRLTNAETDMIFFKLKEDELLEKLRRLRSSMVEYDIGDQERHKDIERFKLIVSDLLEKC